MPLFVQEEKLVCAVLRVRGVQLGRRSKYTKVKVPSTQDKYHVSWAASQSYAATAASL